MSDKVVEPVRGGSVQTWTMLINLHYWIFSIQSLTRKRVKWAKMKLVRKHQIMQVIPFSFVYLLSLLFGIYKQTIFDPFLHHFPQLTLPFPTHFY